VPAQIRHEWNTAAHVSDYEGDPRRRPLTYDEVQALFDAPRRSAPRTPVPAIAPFGSGN
jgi:hypothetical protein